MSKGDLGESTNLSVAEMRTWLSEEVGNVLKECELRIKDATAFTTAYASGELTKDEAHKRLNRYDDRWPAALGGVFASSYQNDDAIIADIDKAHRSDRIARKRYERVPNREHSRGSHR